MANVNPYASNGATAVQQNGGYASGAQPDDMMAFFTELDEIKRQLVQFSDNIDRIEGLHKRSLAEVAGENEEWTQQQIDKVGQETRALGDSLRDRIKKLEKQSLRDNTKRPQVENIKKSFMEKIQHYQAVENAFRQRYREVAERQYRIVRPDATDAEVKEAIEDSHGEQIFSQAFMSSNRRGEARTALTEVQNRHREIQKIEKTMGELAQLFRDMEVLVAEQEEPIRHIDEQATTVQQDIEHGVAHTQKAIISARAARKKKWWCVLIVFIICAIIAIVLGVHFGK
jgi:syntaxin 1B/2/3